VNAGYNADLHILDMWLNMSSFNVRQFFLFTVIIAVSGLSLLFSELYREQIPISYIVIAVYIISVFIIVSVCWRLTKHFFVTPAPEESQKARAQDTSSYDHDPATNLPTAQLALKKFEQVLKSANNKRLAAITFKPINFQHANSLLGHHNSDLLLLQLAYCLRKKVANNSELLNFYTENAPIRIARLQSLNFIVVFDLTDVKDNDKNFLNDVCLQLASSVPDAMSFKSFSLNFELAFGIAISGESGQNVSEIVAYAEDALLRGIKLQQPISYFDHNIVANTHKQLARMEQLSSDIVDESLSLYLQPKVNIKNNDIVGFQLKVHWYEQSDSPLGLSDFSDLAEYSGEVYLLTKQMLKQAFSTLFSLQKRGLYQTVSVSLSSKSLFEADLVDFIEEQMTKYSMAGKYLMIELTESVILSSGQRAKTTIDQLKSLGVTIAISDFSGSYESLRYIRKMAIQQVKIDCQQLTNDSENRVDKAITNALITLTRSMKIPLIGTHIDKDDAAKAYIAMGGKLIQGDIICAGVVPEELELWLNKWFIQHPEAMPSK